MTKPLYVGGGTSARLDAAIAECQRASTEVHDVMTAYATWLKDRADPDAHSYHDPDDALLARLREIAEGGGDAP